MVPLDGPSFSATEGWHWIPGMRDRNTGIWGDVTRSAPGPVALGDLNIITTLPKADRDEADIEIEAPVINSTNSTVEGDLSVRFDDVRVTKHVKLQPGEIVVRLRPEEFARLKVEQPRLWWPNGCGTPALHALTVSFSVAGKLSARQKIDFGMRARER